MQTTKILLAMVAAAALVAACDRNAPKAGAQPSPSGGASQAQGSGSGVQSSAGAASSGKATGEGANPHQQHADPKEPAQHRDFEQKGDSAGPKNPESPKAGK
jgi:hypothetical protein